MSLLIVVPDTALQCGKRKTPRLLLIHIDINNWCVVIVTALPPLHVQDIIHTRTYTLLQQQRGRLEKDTFQHGIWPISKHELITKHLKSFMKFTNSIDYDKL